MKLYELCNEFALLQQRSEDGEINEAELDAITLPLQAKMANICKWFRQLQGDARTVDEEMDRLRELRDSRLKAADQLKAYMLRCLTLASIERLDLELFKVRIQANPPAVTVDPSVNVRDWPDWLWKETITRAPDRKALLDCWRANEPLPDGVSISNGTHLRIQ